MVKFESSHPRSGAFVGHVLGLRVRVRVRVRVRMVG
jgi:hypothetical protein